MKKMLRGEKLEENEVILDISNKFERNVDLSTVVGKCKVSLHCAVLNHGQNGEITGREAWAGHGPWLRAQGKNYISDLLKY